MNAHSKMWNPMMTRNRNHIFWEQLIENKSLFVWNTGGYEDRTGG